MRPWLALPAITICALPFSLGIAREQTTATAAAALPDATAVAGRVGQPVEFQDEIKAVSFSRSTKGYYLSFGAAYPKQTLSVWMAEKEYERVPQHDSMVGRSVRISGQLENSPSGPLVKLASHTALQVLATDESILSKPILDGKQDRAQFESAVYQTFKRGDFDTLETLGQELRQSRERLTDGSWLSDAYFEAFRLNAKTAVTAYAENEQILARWREAKPNSTVLPMMEVGFHLDLAWKWRGEDYASTVRPEGWAGFKRELALARQTIEAHPNDKAYPEYYALLQTLALGEGWPKDRYMNLFDEAVRIAPDYFHFYSNTAWYLMPQWHGRKGEWEAFAERERQEHGAGGAGDALYARIAMAMRRHYQDLFRETAISWDTTASGLEYLIRQYPASRSLKNLYAFLAWRQHDRARLVRGLPAIEPDPDMTIWVNLENVALAQKFAKANTAP